MPATGGVRAFIEAHLRPGMVVLDIGANEGIVTEGAARLVGSTGRVIAYEPFPSSAAAIAGRHERDPHVSVVQAAVSDVSGETTLYLDAERSTRHSLWPGARLVPGDHLQVSSVRLDDMLGELPAVDLVKIDAQGAEARIVRGGFALLSRDRPLLIFELWRKGLKVSATDAESFLDGLASLGYHFHPINGKGALRSDGRIRNFLERESPNASLNILAHPASWPAARWSSVMSPAPCIVPPSPQATCRPWRRVGKRPRAKRVARPLWQRVRARLQGLRQSR